MTPAMGAIVVSDIGAPSWKVSSLGETVPRLCGAVTSHWVPQRSRPSDRALRRRPARQALPSTDVRGDRREPISRQPPRADLPRDLLTNSWHRQGPATARLGVTDHEFLQIDHSGKIRPNGNPWRAAIRLAGPI